MKYVEVFINKESIDLGDSADGIIALTSSINEITDIETRTGSNTNIFKVPGTKNNAKIFGNAQVIANTGTFDPQVKAECLIKVNGIIQLEGVAYLEKSAINEPAFEYEINVVGDNAVLKELLGDKLITELDLSAHNRTWDLAGIQQTWADCETALEGIVFPLIDYNNLSKTGVTQLTLLKHTDFYPAVFVKTVVERMLKEVGYKLGGRLFEVVEMARLIMPFSKGVFGHTSKWLAEASFEAHNNTQNTIAGGSAEQIFFPQGTFNKFNNFNPTTSEFTFPVTSTATVSFHTNSSTIVVTTIEAYINGGPFSGGTQIFVEPIIAASQNFTFDYDFIAGDVLTVWLLNVSGSNFVLETINITIDFAAKYKGGDTLEAASALPEITCMDLLKALFKIPFAYVRTDSKTKTVYLDTRNQFYKPQGEAVDWSDKLDIGKEINISYAIEGYAKNNYFKWLAETLTPDNSGNNDWQKASVNEINTYNNRYPKNLYGDGNQQFRNAQYEYEKTVVEMPFSATWMHQSPFGGKLHLPWIDLLEFDAGGVASIKSNAPQPKMLIYAGQRDIGMLTNGGMGYFSLDTGGAGAIITLVPYAYFWKKEYGASLNAFAATLCFQAPVIDGFYGQDLFAKFYREIFRIIAEGKIAEAWVTLNEVDILNLDFGKYVWIGYFRSYFALDLVEDKIIGDETVNKIRLLRLP